MKAIEFIYQDMQIHFALHQNQNVMVNATEMAKAFNKRIDHFLKSDHAKAFIEALNKTPNSVNLSSEFTPYGGNSAPLKLEEIIQTRGHVGTYFHPHLALKFAAWLDPAFEVWVYRTINELLFGNYNKHSEAALNKIEAEKELKILTEELKTTPEFEKYFQLQQIIKTSDAEKQKAIKAQINQLKMELK